MSPVELSRTATRATERASEGREIRGQLEPTTCDDRDRDRDSEREESTKGKTELECTHTGRRDGVYDARGEKRMGYLQD